MSLVRNDWEYPPITEKATVAGHDEAVVPHRVPLSFRQREEALSDLEADEVFSKRRSKADPYKFESPEAVGNLLAERKRKRRKLVEEEMQYNEGLKTWAQRRDAWTQAVPHKPRRLTTSASIGSPSSPSPRKRPSYKSRLSQSFIRERNNSGSTDDNFSWPASPTSPTPESSSIDSVESASSSNSSDPTSGPWLPVYPPLLPQDDSVRDRIKPQAYPTIYSKIVVQGMAPNVPIPLCHMIPALVEGWKVEGNWPPQPSATLAQDMKKGRKSSSFTKWRTEQQQQQQQWAALNEDKSRVRRSMGMVRRVFGAGSSDGLDELGIEFREHNDKQDGELADNLALNKGLVRR